MASKRFVLQVNGKVALSLQISGSDELVDTFVKQTLDGSFGAFNDLRKAVVEAGNAGIKSATVNEDKK